tara:strand:- start:244 stop:408 length:165 start_codon:yes stop_codon:yes gene_type:complete
MQAFGFQLNNWRRRIENSDRGTGSDLAIKGGSGTFTFSWRKAEITEDRRIIESI